ncbi:MULTISPECIES: 50S ribosomal protein L2 [Holospora]|uniref:Large ribosomal subunit protein uL2 n=2 Tax=Holospora TaxID=44747 RepID=A0A061JG08_9PROT|nr:MULTISPECIES: 50S ribosomal protein L2 [Holospora]ETZ04756.1 50S ribosomal protein L2 [Holospora undulata HU1]GAJ46020.1 50S ribosomal protein L2 [Holospora elegans E1]
MSLKHYNPTSPGRRGLITLDRSELWKGRPEKSLVCSKKRTGGRNAQGRVTCRSRGGGTRPLYRVVDFDRNSGGNGIVSSRVERLEYDPNRSAFLALLSKNDSSKTSFSYVIASSGMKAGSVVYSGEGCEIREGNSLPLSRIPSGTFVYNVELKIGKGAQIARSAGTYAQVMGKELDYVLVRLPSGEVRKIHKNCWATIGVVSNADHRNISLAKAGRNRWLGFRPHVRGVAMNPVDHPLGGGEGRTSGGRHPVSPQGQSAKGLRTRSKKAKSWKLIVSRRKK